MLRETAHQTMNDSTIKRQIYHGEEGRGDLQMLANVDS
jgi:hypothetical protein